MCALLRYSAGALTILLATAYVAASSESGSSAFRPMVLEPASTAQTVVNRITKGDRENARVPATTAQTKPATVAKEQKILEGCDPAFSPLMASAKNNFAGRCLS